MPYGLLYMPLYLMIYDTDPFDGLMKDPTKFWQVNQVINRLSEWKRHNFKIDQLTTVYLEDTPLLTKSWGSQYSWKNNQLRSFFAHFMFGINVELLFIAWFRNIKV